MSYISSSVNSTANAANGGGMWGLNKNQWGAVAGAGGSILGSLLSGGGDSGYGDAIKSLQKTTDTSLDTSKTLGMDSKDLFASVIPYLRAVTGGDRQALLGATMPERKRVIDQYSTARKAIAEFSPRSGGQAGAMIGMNNNEASDLSMVGANARTGAMGTATNLASSFEQQAQQANNAAAQGYSNMAQMSAEQQKQKAAAGAQWGEALGMLAMMAFL